MLYFIKQCAENTAAAFAKLARKCQPLWETLGTGNTTRYNVADSFPPRSWWCPVTAFVTSGQIDFNNRSDNDATSSREPLANIVKQLQTVFC